MTLTLTAPASARWLARRAAGALLLGDRRAEGSLETSLVAASHVRVFVVSASGHTELQSRDRSIVVAALSLEARSPSRARGSGFEASLQSREFARMPVPRAAVRAHPLQHL